jgi:hypothetical protein
MRVPRFSKARQSDPSMGYRVAVDSPMEAARGADASAANAPTVAGKRNDDSRCDCASQRRPVSQVIGLAYKTRREPLETRRQEGSGRSTIAPSLSVLRARHEADRGRLGARKLESALLLVVIGVSERARDHLAQCVTLRVVARRRRVSPEECRHWEPRRRV